MTSSDVIAAESSRSCGECTACCEGWLEDVSLDMKPGKSCAHLKNSACSIYEARPENPCRRFTCAWLHQPEQYPEDLRPDRSGAIVMWDRYWQDWQVLRAVPTGEKIPPETFERLRDCAKSQGLPLLFVERTLKDEGYAGDQLFAMGSPAFAEAVRDGFQDDDLFGMASPHW